MRKRITIVSLLAVVVIAAVLAVVIFQYNKGNEVFSSDEFKEISGDWRITEFVDIAVQSHIDPEPEGYYPSDEEILEHNKQYVGFEFTIDQNNVKSISPPDILFGYVYEYIDDMYFGYKPSYRVELDMPVLYVVVEHKAFPTEINIIKDSSERAYIDIDGYFYRIVKET